MDTGKRCRGVVNSGALICAVHGVRLVDRKSAELKVGRIDQPAIGLFCPVSGKGPFSNQTAADDAIRESGIELPEID
jgi:hypothetical protein